MGESLIIIQCVQFKLRKDRDLKRSLEIKFHKIISFRIISKITVNCQKWFDCTETESAKQPPTSLQNTFGQLLLPKFCHISMQISEIWISFSWWWFSKFSHHAKPFSRLTWSHQYCLKWYHFDVFITIYGHVFIYFLYLKSQK